MSYKEEVRIIKRRLFWITILLFSIFILAGVSLIVQDLYRYQ